MFLNYIVSQLSNTKCLEFKYCGISGSQKYKKNKMMSTKYLHERDTL
jgi:hypothetical protein